MSIKDVALGLRELKTALYRLNELTEDANDLKDEAWVRKQFEISMDIVVSILRAKLVEIGVPTRSAREAVIESIRHSFLPKSDAYRKLLGDYDLVQQKLKPSQAKLIYENIRDRYRDDLDLIYDDLSK